MTDHNYTQAFTWTIQRPSGWTDEQWAAFTVLPEPTPWTLRDDLASALETSYRLADDALRAIRDAGYVIARPDQLRAGEQPYAWNDEERD